MRVCKDATQAVLTCIKCSHNIQTEHFGRASQI